MKRKFTSKRVLSLVVALTVALTSAATVMTPTVAEAKTTVSSKKVNIKAPKTVSARLSNVAGGYDDVVLSWSKTKGTTGYYVYYKKNIKKAKWKYLKRTTVRNLTKKNLADGTSYAFLVKPYKQKGNKIYKSKNYKTVKITTLKKLSAPTLKKNVSGKAIVYWKDINGQDGYQISKSTSKKKTNIVATYKTKVGNSKIVKATNNKRYYYKVRAYKNIKVNGKIKRVYAPWSNVKSYIVKKSAPSHTHHWKNHTVTKKVWVSKIVPVYETKRVKVGTKQVSDGEYWHCNCGAVIKDDAAVEEHVFNHIENDEPDNGYHEEHFHEEPVYKTKKIKVGTKDEGHYETKTYVDYKYCDCGARK